MPIRLNDAAPDFAQRFAELLASRNGEADDVRALVAEILARVQDEGDEAVLDYTRQFDRFDAAKTGLRISADEIDAAHANTDPELREALDFAARRIAAFHVKQKPADMLYEDGQGVTLGMRWIAVDTVGLYVPGGTAAYPSSVLMNAVPARIAGVRHLIMVVPTPDGVLQNPLVLVAAKIAGIDEIYRIGGAQAVAAMAFGTETVPRVDKIIGPGNAFVAEAKRQVFGRIGIDIVAGPSEILIIADGAQNPAWVASDLLSQAEHDPLAQAVLITDDQDFAQAVENNLIRQLDDLPRREIAEKSWESHGAIIVISDLATAPALANQLASEHLEIMIDDPIAMAREIRHAGAIFLGPYTPEVIGDYVGGPNHVLPTSGSARFSSGLGVHDFMKRSTWLGCDATAFGALAGAASTLARAEGLAGHACAIDIRRADREPS